MSRLRQAWEWVTAVTWRWMVALFVLLVLLGMAAECSAATLRWTDPLTRTDGTVLSDEEIASYTVLIWSQGYGTTSVAVGNAAGPANEAIVALPRGVSALRVMTVDTGGRVSDPSDRVVCRVGRTRYRCWS